MRVLPALLALALLILPTSPLGAENFIYSGSTRIFDWEFGGSERQAGYMIVGDFTKVSDYLYKAKVSWVDYGGMWGAGKMWYISPIEVEFRRSEEGRGTALTFKERKTQLYYETDTMMILQGNTVGKAFAPARFEGIWHSYEVQVGRPQPTISRSSSTWQIRPGLTDASNRAAESQAAATDRVMAYLETRGFTYDE